MFKKLKDILGIEGIKIQVVFDEPVVYDEEVIHGHLVFTTLREQEIEFIELKLIEKYERGRKENKLIDEYELGKIILANSFVVTKGKQIKIEFQLPFMRTLSEMDHISEQNIFNRGLVSIAKKLKGVKSTYTLIAKAKVKGTTFSPATKRPVIFDN